MMTISDYSQHQPYNAASDFIDANASRRGDKIAFTDPSRTLTYGALQAASSRFARGLLSLGVRPESRVVFFSCIRPAKIFPERTVCPIFVVASASFFRNDRLE